MAADCYRCGRPAILEHVAMPCEHLYCPHRRAREFYREQERVAQGLVDELSDDSDRIA